LNSKLRSIFLFVLKLALTVAILWQIFRKIDLTEVGRNLLGLPWWLFLVLLLITLIRQWGQYRNWSFSLRLSPAYVPHRGRELVSYMVGNPLRFVIPGGSGSIGKIMFVNNSSRWASLLSFGAERAFMTWSTWTYALAAALAFYAGVPLWIRVAAFVICIFAPLWAYPLLGLGQRSQALKPHYRKLVPRIVAIQLMISALSYLQYWLILLRIREIGFLDSLLRMALTQFSNSIPVTVAGLGLRESFAIHFLDGAGFSAAQAVSATLTLFVIQDVIPALAGLPLLIQSHKHKA
jgi:hypothetical protein